MGKGGYLGGGTIIGPGTPDWFSHNDEIPVEFAKAAPAVERPQGPLTRDQRRKLAQARREARAAKSVQPMKPQQRAPLTEGAQRRIDTLKIDIKGLEQQLASCQQALDRSRQELGHLLRQHGLTTETKTAKEMPKK